MLIESFNTIVKIVEVIVSMQDTIITMYLPDSDKEKQAQLKKMHRRSKAKQKEIRE